MKLSETKIKNFNAKSKPYKMADGDGLFMHISVTGKKTWRIKYYFEKKEQTITIGEYPYISLKDARLKLFELKSTLVHGLNPKKPANEVRLFKDIAYEWLETQKNWSEAHSKIVLYRLERYILSHIGDSDIKTLTTTDVLGFLRKIEKSGRYETASKVLGICARIFVYSVACGYSSQNPCRDLRGVLTTVKEKPRSAITDPKEVAVLMKNIFAYPRQQMRNALLFSAYTFCRPGEIRHAEWSEIDFETKEWKIPAKKMKMKKDHRVPLAEQCIAILEQMKDLDRKWVFPSSRIGKPLSEAGVLSAIRNMGYEKHEMCAHGFRSMASTLLNEQGYKADLIEKALAHGDDNNIRGIYNRTDYFEERRKMMQEWADYLDNLANHT